MISRDSVSKILLHLVFLVVVATLVRGDGNELFHDCSRDLYDR